MPISSTGHLILTADLLKIAQTDFVKSFEIIIQLGAIAAVVLLYWRTLTTSKLVWSRILIAFLPTAIVGFILYKSIKSYLIGNTLITLAALLFGGIMLIALELHLSFPRKRESLNPRVKHEDDKEEKNSSEIEKITTKQAFFIGLCQSVSIVPGVSRAAASIIGGLFVGAKRKTAVEFSFLLAVPTMLAATGLDLIKSDFSFSGNEYGLLAIGFLGSFIVAIGAVKFLLQFVQTHTFIPFGIYRIILSILFLLFIT